jgi:uncharacterized membrane protein (UPF0127 family)
VRIIRAAALLIAALPAVARGDPLLTYPLKIKGHAARVELAKDDETRRLGLMYRRQLAESSGMLFVYEQEGAHAMWMKNTYVPLSVAFIARDGRILNIEDMQPLTETPHQAAGAAKFALEMNQGWFRKRSIKPGDRVSGLERIPDLD